MNFFIAVIVLVAIAIGVLFVMVVVGIPEEKKEYHRNISTDNIVNDINYSFCENEVQKPYYHYGFEHYTYRVSHFYYLKNMGNNDIENLDIFPVGFRIGYAKFHNKIEKWVILLYSTDFDSEGGMEYTKVHLYTFENKDKITKSIFIDYSLPNSMKLDYEVDSVEEKILYYDKDHKPQKIDIK